MSEALRLAYVAGGIVGARNNVLTAEPLKASGKAARRMERSTLKYRLHESHGFFNLRGRRPKGRKRGKNERAKCVRVG